MPKASPTDALETFDLTKNHGVCSILVFKGEGVEKTFDPPSQCSGRLERMSGDDKKSMPHLRPLSALKKAPIRNGLIGVLAVVEMGAWWDELVELSESMRHKIAQSCAI